MDTSRVDGVKAPQHFKTRRYAPRANDVDPLHDLLALLERRRERLHLQVTLGREDAGHEERLEVDVPVSIDGVATRPRLPHATRRLSHGHVDGVTVSERRIDAVDAKLKLRNSKKMTLSQHRWRRTFAAPEPRCGGRTSRTITCATAPSRPVPSAPGRRSRCRSAVDLCGASRSVRTDSKSKNKLPTTSSDGHESRRRHEGTARGRGAPYGFALANSFTAFATRLSELPSRNTGFTALPRTLA